MKLIGKLRKKAESARAKEEAKEIIRDTIEEAGMLLDDDDLEHVAGGEGHFTPYRFDNRLM